VKSLALLSLAPLVLAIAAPAQRAVSLDGSPAVTQIEIGPSNVVPRCTAVATSCPAPVPAFPPGSQALSAGGEAVDELGGVIYTSDGLRIAASTFPGCQPGASYPIVSWPRVAGPCATMGIGPVIALADAAGVGTLWVLDTRGVISLVPFPPGPILAQVRVPTELGTSARSISWDPATDSMYIASASTFWIFRTPTPTGLACQPLSVTATYPIPPCIFPAPTIGITVHTARSTSAEPNVLISDGLLLIDLLTGDCSCAVSPPASMIATDLDFATVPKRYGAGCGCAAITGTPGGLPVLGNAAFAIDATNAPMGSFAVLNLSTAPAAIPLGAGCNLLLAPPLLSLPAVPVTSGGSGYCTGTATLPLPIPANAVLQVGTPLYFQWVFLPTGAPLGLELSDALELVIGFG
jgi:hypothetical protein